MAHKKEYYIEDTFTGTTEELAALFATSFSDEYNICSPSFLQWQCFDNPNGDAFIISARDKVTNELVGVRTVLPVLLTIESRHVKAALAVNTFAREDFRGMGVFTNTVRRCHEYAPREGIEIIFSFPNANSFPGYTKKLSYQCLGHLNYLVKPLNPLGTLQNILLKNNKFSKIDIPEKQLTDGYNIIKYKNEFALQITTFLEAFNNSHKITTLRTLDYLKWRYINHPTIDYGICFVEKSNNIQAMIVFAVDAKNTQPSVNMADFCVLKGYEKAGVALVRYVSKRLKKNGILFIKAFAQPLTQEYRILQKQRFIKKEKLSRQAVFAPMIFQKISQNEYDITFEDWHVVMGDTDVV